LFFFRTDPFFLFILVGGVLIFFVYKRLRSMYRSRFPRFHTQRMGYWIRLPWISLKGLEIELTPRELRLLDWNVYEGPWDRSIGVSITTESEEELRTLFEFAPYYGNNVQDRIFNAPIERHFESAGVNQLKNRINREIEAHGFVMISEGMPNGKHTIRYRPQDEPEVNRKQELYKPGLEGFMEGVSGIVNEIKRGADERNQLRKMIEDSIAKRNAESK